MIHPAQAATSAESTRTRYSVRRIGPVVPLIGQPQIWPQATVVLGWPEDAMPLPWRSRAIGARIDEKDRPIRQRPRCTKASPSRRAPMNRSRPGFFCCLVRTRIKRPGCISGTRGHPTYLLPKDALLRSAATAPLTAVSGNNRNPQVRIGRPVRPSRIVEGRLRSPQDPTRMQSTEGPTRNRT